jgi:hypothetical protein
MVRAESQAGMKFPYERAGQEEGVSSGIGTNAVPGIDMQKRDEKRQSFTLPTQMRRPLPGASCRDSRPLLPDIEKAEDGGQRCIQCRKRLTGVLQHYEYGSAAHLEAYSVILLIAWQHRYVLL